jgi:O-antigen/teichoic acid export membrane protein
VYDRPSAELLRRTDDVGSKNDNSAAVPGLNSDVRGTAPAAPQHTKRRITASVIWRAIEAGGNELIAFVVFAVMARLLAPDHFGAVALAGSIVTLMQVVLYNGFTEALIQRQGTTDAHHHVVSLANLVFASALALTGIALAWPMGALLGRPDFPVIFCAFMPSLLFRGLSSPMLAALRRDLDFKSIALRTLLGVVIGGAVAIMLARAGAGYWALVAQQWSYELVSFAVLTWASPKKPWQLRWNKAAFAELLPVALPVMGANLFSSAARRLDTVALGLFLVDWEVGIYFLVYRLVHAAQLVTQHGLNDVAIVVLANMNTDDERYRRGLLQTLRLSSFVCCCGFGLLAVVGPWLLPIVFGPNWQPATKPLQVLAALSTAGAVVSVAGVVLVAGGRAAAYGRLATFAAMFQLVAVFTAARWGLTAVAWAAGIAQVLTILPAMIVVSRSYRLPLTKVAAELLPVALVFVVSLGIAFAFSRSLHSATGNAMSLLSFVVIMGIGAVMMWPREWALGSLRG